jgi:hypothetical protein
MGAPLGNQNAVKAKRWQQAIDRALEKKSKAAGIEELDRLAEKFLDCVDAGAKDYMPGFSALGDRLDGKPKQQIEASGPDGGAIVTKIVREVVPVESKP